ncbi:MAG: DUF11 domain-containing protein [Methanosarcinales archaeon]|nr:DUF11 domain-containing protein [Methanosarcinales archaeon]
MAVSGDAGTSLKTGASGSGTYYREEQLHYLRMNRSIRAASNLSASHQATEFELPGGRSVSYRSKWSQWDQARNHVTSESVEESYRYASRIERDGMIALDRNGTSMAVNSRFEGLRHAGYLQATRPDGRGHSQTLQELTSDYAGSFSVKERLGTAFSNRSTAITAVKHYDQPHLTIYQRGERDRTNENNLNYTISILNDGNRSLGPVHVTDVFPAGTRFYDASTRPTEELDPESGQANWTFAHLPAGEDITIYLRVMRYVVLDGPVNRVFVEAGCDGRWISANNSTSSNFNWLGCTPQGACNAGDFGWSPPDWGFDLSQDICGSCAYSVPPEDGG